jgi:hypothetical protein
MFSTAFVEPLQTLFTNVAQVVEPEGLKVVLDDLLANFKIEVLLYATVVGAERDTSNDKITSVEILEKHGRYRAISAKAFVDCSGDCDLAFHAKASTRYGNDGLVNLGSLSTRWGGLENASPTVQQWKEAVRAAKEADHGLKSMIPKDGSVLIRLTLSRDICSYMASAIHDARSARSMTCAEQQGRKQAQEYLKILKKLPGHEKMYLVSTGPNFGTRESRHIVSRSKSKTSFKADDSKIPLPSAHGASSGMIVQKTIGQVLSHFLLEVVSTSHYRVSGA